MIGAGNHSAFDPCHSIFSETLAVDTKPNKHTKGERIRKCLKLGNNILISWSLEFSLKSIF